MTGIAAASTMTNAIYFYEYLDIEAAAAMAALEQLGGDVRIHSDWEATPVRTLLELEHLQANWDGYNAPRPTKRSISVAISLIGQIADLGADILEAPFVVPIAAGGVAVEFLVGQRELNFSVFNDDEAIQYLKSEAGEPFEEGVLTFHSPGRIRQLVSWVSSAPAQHAPA